MAKSSIRFSRSQEAIVAAAILFTRSIFPAPSTKTANLTRIFEISPSKMNSPVELPTKRNSFRTPLSVDVNDPGWIPVLDPTVEPVQKFGSSGKSPLTFGVATFSSATRTSSRSALTHSHSKSSVAPERVPSEPQPASNATTDKVPPVPPKNHENVELPASRPTSHFFERRLRTNTVNGSLDASENTTDTDGTGDSVADRSTVGTASLLDDHVPALPVVHTPKEEIPVPASLPSARASNASTRKSAGVAVPTSKYNRKPLPSQVVSPFASPRVTQVFSQPRSQNDDTTPAATPISIPEIPSPNLHTQVSNNLSHTKSTASQKKQRALHSHPSNPSIKSRRNSSSSEADDPIQVAATVPLPLSRPPSHRSRKSTDSRMAPRPSTFDAQLPIPTPAPTTPLPQLPPHAPKPSPFSASPEALTEAPSKPSSPIKSPPLAHLPDPCPTRAAADHTEMAAFMTTTNTMIFRRFDDVHVQLLLCLQDEISQLERELLGLDSASMTRNERTTERTRILRDLRRVVGEYDHLFSSWSQMQANKATKATTQSLRQWLEKPTTSAGAGLGKSVKEDLVWLEGSKDLSSVNLAEETPLALKKEGGGGFAALFAGCGGRRK